MHLFLTLLTHVGLDYSFNTRRQVRGRGTEEQGNVTNNTNMFHLGTRIPSMGPNNLEGWDEITPPQLSRGNSVLLDTPQSAYFYTKEDSPYNSFHPGKKYALLAFHICLTINIISEILDYGSKVMDVIIIILLLYRSY